MLTSRKFFRPIVATVIAGLFVTSMPMPRAQAALVTSQDLSTQRSAAADRARINDLMAREDIQREFKNQGISPQEAQARVNSMTDQEISQVVGRLDQLPAGQSAVGAIIGAAVLIFIVLLITDIVGWTRVFPFTRAQR
jgi:hypothetical protein